MVWIFMITVKYNLYIWSLHPRALAFDFHFKTGRASELKPVICPLTSLALLLWKAQTPLCLSHLAPSTSYKMLALFSSNTSPLPLTPSSKLGSSRNPAFASHNPAGCHLITLWVPSVFRLNSQLKLVLSWILWQYSGMQLDLIRVKVNSVASYRCKTNKNSSARFLGIKYFWFWIIRDTQLTHIP